MKKILLLLLPLVIAGFIPAADDARDDLHALFADHWEHHLQRNPKFATSYGDTRFNERLGDESFEVLTRENEVFLVYLDRLRSIDRTALSDQDLINYDMFEMTLLNSIEAFELGAWRLPMNGWWDWHASFAEMPNRVPLNTVQDYENHIARLRDFARHNNEHIDRLLSGIQSGWVRPAVVFGPYVPSE